MAIAVHDIPRAISNDSDIETEVTREFNIRPKNKEVLDWAQLDESDKDNVLSKGNNVFKALEETDPAAGYKVRVVGSNAGRNPLEFHVYAYGSRELGSEMKMPTPPKCVFCEKVEKGEKIELEGFKDLSDADVQLIKTLQDNLLIISGPHKKHWFDLIVGEQKKMLDTAMKIIAVFKKDPNFKMNYELHMHCGVEGHQKVPHVHMHMLLGTSRFLLA